MKKMIILQTVAPDYRKKVFLYIKQRLKNNFSLLYGDNYFESSVKTDKTINFGVNIKNHYFFNRKFLFQTDMWWQVLKADLVVIEMNPRIISNWGILIFRKILLKKTVLWGHAWPRKGQKSKSDIIRNLMRKLSDIIIVYTKTQAVELRKKMPKKMILSAPNAVIYSKEMEANEDEKVIKNIIYVGRLTKKKKPLFLAEAFYKIIDKLPVDVKLIFVGDGEEKNKIETFIKENNLIDKIILKGHISDYNMLKNIYKESLLSVSPGYVGLSITQSFGFGVPMLISKSENHSPEIEAAGEGKNAQFFETDNQDSLGDKIQLFYKNKTFWINRRREICSQCKGAYTVDNMANTFINIYKKWHL